MYKFAEYLDKRGFKYIWANNKMSAPVLSTQVDFGVKLSCPIKGINDNLSDVPICVIISPNHKEGFSFTFNPGLISLGLSETAGDEEQIYGRVLRKYGVDGWMGKYDKKIYQYFSSGNYNTKLIPKMTALYGMDDNTMFRKIYEPKGAINGEILQKDVEFIKKMELNIKSSLELANIETSIISPEIQDFISKQKSTRYWDSEGNVEKNEEYLNEYNKEIKINKKLWYNFIQVGVESQLTFLSIIKKINLDFFQKIAIKENNTFVDKTVNYWTVMQGSKMRSLYKKYIAESFLGEIPAIKGFIQQNEPVLASSIDVFCPFDLQYIRQNYENLVEDKQNKDSQAFDLRYFMSISSKDKTKLVLSSPIISLSTGIECSEQLVKFQTTQQGALADYKIINGNRIEKKMDNLIKKLYNSDNLLIQPPVDVKHVDPNSLWSPRNSRYTWKINRDPEKKQTEAVLRPGKDGMIEKKN
jgi:hypothetical protein